MASMRTSGRRAWAAVAASAVAVVAVAGGSAAVLAGQGPQPPPQSPTEPDAEGKPAWPSPGTRLVGLGHAAIAVPTRWATNRLHCGTPQADTVVINLGGVNDCGSARPTGVESVNVRPGRPDWHVVKGKPTYGWKPDQTLEIDGVPAERDAAACGPDPFGPAKVCTATFYIPSEDVAFHIASSTSRAEVDRVLARIRIMPDAFGVLSFWPINHSADERAGEVYVDALRAAGLVVEVRRELFRPAQRGLVRDVSPAAGTMLSPGETVTVTVNAPPGGRPTR